MSPARRKTTPKVATLTRPIGKFQMFSLTVSHTQAAPVTNEADSSQLAVPPAPIPTARRTAVPIRIDAPSPSLHVVGIALRHHYWTGPGGRPKRVAGNANPRSPLRW